MIKFTYMNTENTNNYEEESTKVDTQIDTTTADATSGQPEDSTEAQIEKTTESEEGGAWKKVTIGGAVGLVLGSTVSYLSSAKAATTAEAETAVAEDNGNPLVDDSMEMATAVSDDMPFSQAFAAARAEVGSGGAFEWHGNVYSTFTAEEWAGMSSEDKAEYNSHFAWNRGDAASGSVVHGDMAASGSGNHSAEHADAVQQPQGQPHEAAQTAQQASADVNTGGASATTAAGDVHVEAVQEDIEVLGVVHDTETGMNFAGLSVNGQEAVLVDVDGDEVFDAIASDLNNDGQISDNEVADVSQAGISVSTLGGFTDGGDMYADEGPDYANEGLDYGA